MERLIFSGKCIETGKTLTGSLIQFDDGTTTIMHTEENNKGITSPVDPDSVYLANGSILMIDDPE